MRAVSSIPVCLPSFIFKKLNFLRFRLPPALCPPWNVLSKVDMKNHLSLLPLGSPHTGSQGHGDHPRPPKSKKFAIPSTFLARYHPHLVNQCLELFEEIMEEMLCHCYCATHRCKDPMCLCLNNRNKYKQLVPLLFRARIMIPRQSLFVTE